MTETRTRIRPGVAAADHPKSTRSGYARDIKPERVDGDEAAGRAVPIANEHGAQSGRVPPAQRKPAQYEAVTLGEANNRRVARERGEMEPIEGGIDGPGAVKPGLIPEISQYDDTRMEKHDAPEETGEAGEAGEAIVTPRAIGKSTTNFELSELLAENIRLKRELAQQQTEPVKDGLDAYFERRIRIGFALNEGTYAVPAIDVVESPCGIIILLPTGAGDATFIPNPGAEVQVIYGNQSWDCYFPGTSFELPDLGVLAIAMVRKNEG